MVSLEFIRIIATCWVGHIDNERRALLFSSGLSFTSFSFRVLPRGRCGPSSGIVLVFCQAGGAYLEVALLGKAGGATRSGSSNAGHA